MSFGRGVKRRAGRFLKKLSNAPAVIADDGKEVRDPMASHVGQLAVIRVKEIPPPPPGAGDTARDDIDPVAYRRGLNAAKRCRRERRST